MSNGEVIIANGEGVYAIKVSGRATFECAPPLRALSKELDQTSFQKVEIDLEDCQGMDSTFMGVLAMMALRAKKIGAEIIICNASEPNKTLLYGLGLKKLFQFTIGHVDVGDAAARQSEAVDQRTNATTVLEAHKTLMGVDEENVKKFEKVVDFVQKDLDKLNDTKS